MKPADGSTKDGRVVVYLFSPQSEASEGEGAQETAPGATTRDGNGEGAQDASSASAARHAKSAQRAKRPLSLAAKVALAKMQAAALRTAAAQAVPFCEDCQQAGQSLE